MDFYKLILKQINKLNVYSTDYIKELCLICKDILYNIKIQYDKYAFKLIRKLNYLLLVKIREYESHLHIHTNESEIYQIYSSIFAISYKTGFLDYLFWNEFKLRIQRIISDNNEIKHLYIIYCLIIFKKYYIKNDKIIPEIYNLIEILCNKNILHQVDNTNKITIPIIINKIASYLNIDIDINIQMDTSNDEQYALELYYNQFNL
jgi:hypothetical protein